ncbi:hypothetical protein K491DRAFT_715849 [Lophiostoma macrostomum CBS 122681]|uniref:AA1-like domain-containing protein n=1 Tax=Lophiostoma macrostomum CBS 122681 TaxID=1314788 RepID=A0A6A6T767_9PLEO|nr:hypothetical protein K491DRAFT_715849 [Lophiostoma macrostomum CBS 122681]
MQSSILVHISAFLAAAPFAAANFHILQGHQYIQGSEVVFESDHVSYAPSNQYSCSWLGNLGQVNSDREVKAGPTTIEYPSATTFTSTNAICGVEGLTFHYRESGGFSLTDANGDAGSCDPNDSGSSSSLFCWDPTFTVTTNWRELYVCYSYACQDGSDGS